MITKEKLNKVFEEVIEEREEMSRMMYELWNSANENCPPLAKHIEKIQDKFGLYPAVNHELALFSVLEPLREIVKEHEELKGFGEFLELKRKMEVIKKIVE